jgi:RNA-directed DNA polymerase
LLREEQYEATVPTIKDRVVQMALKLVLEPIFESGFYPSSYGYRPGRRAHDAIAEIVHFAHAPSDYEWVIEADIEACFDRLAHSQILGEVRRRVGDKRVLGLVRTFLKAGVMTETGRLERTVTGTPQGGIMTAPTQSRTSSLSGRFGGLAGGSCREAWYSSG